MQWVWGQQGANEVPSHAFKVRAVRSEGNKKSSGFLQTHSAA